jgi:serine/threonine protein kinase
LDDESKNNLNQNTLLGTPLYMSPQILNNENYSIKTDVWSLGIIFYELVSGVHPWPVPKNSLP